MGEHPRHARCIERRNRELDVERIEELERIEDIDGGGRGQDEELGSLLRGRPFDAGEERLKHCVGEAGSDARIVEETLEIIEDDHRHLRAERVIEDARDVRRLCVFMDTEQGGRRDEAGEGESGLQRHRRGERRLARPGRPLENHGEQVCSRRVLQLLEEHGARLLEARERSAVIEDAVRDNLIELIVRTAEGGLELRERAVKVGACHHEVIRVSPFLHVLDGHLAPKGPRRGRPDEALDFGA
mmetsp:Transcript_25436/g.77197  ORF Transcript_25436/g.77197 Transcript_25436/m.77197 type:complete len:243 (+) Transcript_25436:868-1596(+)|eukprot:scaffold284025_cov28-Tisochrysis_lutea.AAC.2